jgi:hypothetical protein
MDGGKTMTYCGPVNPVMENVPERNVARIKVEAPTIGWCRVQYPDKTTVKQGETSEIIYGQVYVEGCSEGEKICGSVKAEAGYGLGDDLSSYTWSSAVYNDAFNGTSTDNDEYAASFEIGKDVVDITYNLIYRFSIDNGLHWTYCDYDNVEGFDVNNSAKLIVQPADPVMGEPFVRGVDYACGIEQYLASVSATVSTPKDIYGQIWMPGCTDNGKCANIVGSHFHYISSENANSDIRSGEWTVVDAEYNEGYEGTSNDEYMVNVSIDTAGQYVFAYSFDLKRDPADKQEKAQRVFCYVNWQDLGFGSLNVCSDKCVE